jgi:prepilin-type processing-associated H-X9-DG protein
MMSDENQNSINDAGLATCANVQAPAFIDYPSSAHNGGCGMSFCDGHAELHKWKGTGILWPSPNAAHGYNANNPLDKVDFQWLAQNSSAKVR